MTGIFNRRKYITRLNRSIYLLTGILFLFSAFRSQAALPGPVIVSAIADTNQIRIGEQFKITLKVSAPSGLNLRFPAFPDTLNGIEIISRSAVDTSLSEDKSNTSYSQALQVTSFDSGFYVVEPFHFTSINSESGLLDTFSTEAFLITVKSVPVDTTKAIKDIKAPIEVSITLQEIVLIAALILIALLLIWLFIRLWKKRKIKTGPVVSKVPARPPHETALEALKNLEKEKLWQQGFFKKYQSAVSDILREYIEHSFEISALELTSDETLERMRRKKVDETAVGKLATVLHTADLVKFAKVIPMPDENETAMKYAYEFVHLTRPLQVEDLSKKEEVK